MKNKLSDLNNHLFAQLEKLSDETLKGEELKQEIQRAAAMSEISDKIIGAASVSVAAFRLVANGHAKREDLPLLLSNNKKEE